MRRGGKGRRDRLEEGGREGGRERGKTSITEHLLCKEYQWDLYEEGFSPLFLWPWLIDGLAAGSVSPCNAVPPVQTSGTHVFSCVARMEVDSPHVVKRIVSLLVDAFKPSASHNVRKSISLEMVAGFHLLGAPRMEHGYLYN